MVECLCELWLLSNSGTKIPTEVTNVQSPLEDFARASPPQQNSVCSVEPAVVHNSKIEDSQVADLKSKRKRRNRSPNAITCLVKTGRGLAPLRIRCSQYLKKTRRYQTCFKVRLSCVKVFHPWRYCRAAVRIQPLVARRNKSHHQQLVDVAVVQPMKSCDDLNNSDDIDNIFSVLKV